MRTMKAGLAAALALGGLLALTNLASAQDSNQNKKGRFTPEQRLEQMTKDLTLTDAQKPKVKAVLEETSKERAELRNVDQSERREKARAMMEKETKKLKEILTPEQFEKWQKLQQERRGGGKKGEGAKKSADDKKE